VRVRLRWLTWVAAAALVVGAVWVSRGVQPDDVTRAAGAPSGSVLADSDLPVLDSGPLPSVESAQGWLNSPPLTDLDLRSKVVLVDFWTFGCINCQHTLSHVKAWYARYASYGLVLVSVHTPEFAAEADPDNVAGYVRREAIEYPVALDPARTVWRAWDNHAWPAFYLYDSSGRLRLVHLGEGRYEATENAIRLLLGVAAGVPRADV
jgi:thiol-disulfide isomerase/thioredoxin